MQRALTALPADMAYSHFLISYSLRPEVRLSPRGNRDANFRPAVRVRPARSPDPHAEGADSTSRRYGVLAAKKARDAIPGSCRRTSRPKGGGRATACGLGAAFPPAPVLLTCCRPARHARRHRD